MHILSPNIYRSISEAIDSFDYITTKGKIFLKFVQLLAIFIEFENYVSVCPYLRQIVLLFSNFVAFFNLRNCVQIDGYNVYKKQVLNRAGTL